MMTSEYPGPTPSNAPASPGGAGRDKTELTERLQRHRSYHFSPNSSKNQRRKRFDNKATTASKTASEAAKDLSGRDSTSVLHE